MSQPQPQRDLNRMADAFDATYAQIKWGSHDGQKSGPGSTIEATRECVRFLDSVIRERDVRSILDVSCGNMRWQKLLIDMHPNVKFIGLDVSKTVIEENRRNFPGLKFECVNSASAVSGRLPKADLVICRHTMMHLALEDAVNMLRNVTDSASKCVCVTTHDTVCPFENETTYLSL
jgi:SAM-dependent methyltransferase